MSFLDWIESTWLSTLLRESNNVFVYPTILAFHTVGLAFVVGISTAVALRTFGVAPGVPLAPFKKFLPVMYLGFWVNAASGVLLLLIDPTRFLTMADFYVKLAAIAGAIVSMRLLQASLFGDPATLASRPISWKSKVLAGTALAFWGAAITAGRLTAYDDPSAQRQTALAIFIATVVLLIVGYVAARLWSWSRSARQRHRHAAAIVY